MELEKLFTNLLNRLDRIDEDSKGTIIEDIINKLSHQIDHADYLQVISLKISKF